MSGRRDWEAALRPVAGVAGVQVVGALDDVLLNACGVVTTARSVWLHEGVVDHIHDRRGLKREDALFALEHLPATVLRPHYFGRDPRDKEERRIDLVHLVHEVGDRPLYVALKLVRAAEAESERDEIWVSTAYPIGRSFLNKSRYSHLRRAPELQGG